MLRITVKFPSDKNGLSPLKKGFIEDEKKRLNLFDSHKIKKNNNKNKKKQSKGIKIYFIRPRSKYFIE